MISIYVSVHATTRIWYILKNDFSHMQQNCILNIFFRFLFLYDIFIYFQQHFYTSFYKDVLPLPQKRNFRKSFVLICKLAALACNEIPSPTFFHKKSLSCFFKFYQVVIAQWLARLLATREVSEFKSRQGIVNRYQCI